MFKLMAAVEVEKWRASAASWTLYRQLWPLVYARLARWPERPVGYAERPVAYVQRPVAYAQRPGAYAW